MKILVFLQSLSLEVARGDIIILGTDGLLDNVFGEEAAAVVTYCRDRGNSAQGAALSLGQFALGRARDTQHMSPFALAAHAYGFPFRGGKLDDITILCTYIL
jgi:protein phosphatase PTC7